MKKIIFMGTPEFSVPVLEGLIENYEVVAVVTQPDRRIGRKQELVPSQVKQLALKNKIPVLQPIKIKEDYEEILSYQPDMIVTCAYGQIIPKEVLNFPKDGCINVHASLLPLLRGGAPIHKALMEGHEKTGITIMYMDEKMDTGDIITQEEVKISETDNLESLQKKLSITGKELLLKTLPLIFKGENERIKQDEKKATYAYTIKKEDEKLNLEKSAKEVWNHIRGLSEEPGAYLLWNHKILKVYQAYIGEKRRTDQKIGSLSGIYKDGIGIYCKDLEIIIQEVKPEGKKKMKAKDFINGIPKEKLKDFVAE